MRSDKQVAAPEVGWEPEPREEGSQEGFLKAVARQERRTEVLQLEQD